MNLKKMSLIELKIHIGSGIKGKEYKEAMSEYRERIYRKRKRHAKSKM